MKDVTYSPEKSYIVVAVLESEWHMMKMFSANTEMSIIEKQLHGYRNKYGYAYIKESGDFNDEVQA
jgi:hypothetical protein